MNPRNRNTAAGVVIVCVILAALVVAQAGLLNFGASQPAIQEKSLAVIAVESTSADGTIPDMNTNPTVTPPYTPMFVPTISPCLDPVVTT